MTRHHIRMARWIGRIPASAGIVDPRGCVSGCCCCRIGGRLSRECWRQRKRVNEQRMTGKWNGGLRKRRVDCRSDAEDPGRRQTLAVASESVPSPDGCQRSPSISEAAASDDGPLRSPRNGCCPHSEAQLVHPQPQLKAIRRQMDAANHRPHHSQYALTARIVWKMNQRQWAFAAVSLRPACHPSRPSARVRGLPGRRLHSDPHPSPFPALQTLAPSAAHAELQPPSRVCAVKMRTASY